MCKQMDTPVMASVTATGRKRVSTGPPGGASAVDRHCAKKRKRKQAKKHRDDEDTADPASRPAASHTLLSQYYTRLRTLRDHLLDELPPASRIRRRKLASVGKQADGGAHDRPLSDLEKSVAQLLDTTVVASSHRVDRPQRWPDGRWDQWVSFSQKGDESYVSLSDGVAKALFCQSEIVSFAIWSLFEKEKKDGGRPRNVLSDGFRRAPAWRANEPGNVVTIADAVPGLFAAYPNQRVRALKESPWPELLSLLGQAGEKMMIDLLLDYSVFVSVPSGSGNLYQLTGKPLNDLETLASRLPPARPRGSSCTNGTEKSPADIVFVRSRMLYSRAALNARGTVNFGLRHIHVLNRYPFIRAEAPGGEALGREETTEASRRNTLHCMMYLFPRQFGLHNAFTSAVDSSQTTQKFQDYTLREEEIQQKLRGLPSKLPKLPRRLRGSAFQLVQKLQILHGRCSHSALLQHYCPAPAQAGISSLANQRQGIQNRSVLDLSTPVSHVSAYCQAVLRKIIPSGFWGSGQGQVENQRVFLKHVDHFVKLRRFETMSLHELRQGFKITEIDWLAPPGVGHQKTSQTDMRKRTEIFLEFLYYLVDSLLIPLLRSNFYITESSSHRSRLFYFRHDVWRCVAEPAMSALKVKMFEEVRPVDAQRILGSRDLGFSQVRLLPKETGMRPITNLRRRSLISTNKKVLGPSINSILGPIHTVLKFEKNLNPSRLGATMFSVSDLYPRIKAFKQRVGTHGGPFYFAKVDVQAAFDTIPQAAVLRLMASIPSLAEYKVVKHVEMEAEVNNIGGSSVARAKVTKRWRSAAKSLADHSSFMDLLVHRIARGKKDTVFVDSVVQRTHKTRDLLDLMVSHIEQHLVRIGKKYYRQKEGIPQGSILSSLLCNYFYADLESKHLSFLRSNDCLLLRLIDDFLLITTDQAKAARFVEVMHAGVPEYGVTVNPGKSLVNFGLTCGGSAVPRLDARSRGEFPYCGTLINCGSLGIAKNRAARPRVEAAAAVVSDSLTVDFSRHQGQNFVRKAVNAFKIQSHLMFFDTAHNSHRTVLRNVGGAMAETAAKMWAYVRCLPRPMRPCPRLVAAAIDTVADTAYALLKSRSRKQRFPDYSCDVRREQIRRVALHAFKRVLARKQSNYGEVLSWLESESQGQPMKRKLGSGVIN